MAQKHEVRREEHASASFDFSSWQQSPITELTLLQACFEQE